MKNLVFALELILWIPVFLHICTADGRLAPIIVGAYTIALIEYLLVSWPQPTRCQLYTPSIVTTKKCLLCEQSPDLEITIEKSLV